MPPSLYCNANFSLRRGVNAPQGIEERCMGYDPGSTAFDLI
jgi:hypothetical protein